MKQYYKEGSLKAVNGYLRKLNLDDFQLEQFPINENEVTFDFFIDEEQTKSASVVFYKVSDKITEAHIMKCAKEELNKLTIL